MKRNCLNVAVKYLIGVSLALIAVSNCFNVLSSSSFFVASPSSDVSRAEAAKPDSQKLSPPSSVSDKLDGGSSLFNSPLNSPDKRSTSPWAGLRPVSLASPFATTLTATKTDNISTPVNPGDTIMYTVEITNTGAMDATNVNFTDTIDANTTLVAGSVAVAPIAVNDAYNTIGNVNITIPVGQGVIANDLNPNGSGTLAVTLVNATAVPGTAATANGSVTMASDGSFTYTPNAGFSGPTDTFTYTLGNSATPGKTDTATVTITVSGRIWFVNSAAGVNGDGRLNTPFNILTGAGSADSVDAANDVIFLYSSGTNYTGGITLNSAEKVIGQGASQSILTITGFTAPSGTNLLPATGGANPVITTAGAVAITLGANNGLHGFTVGNTGAAGTDISGTSFGTLTAMKITLNGTGRALNLATGTMASGSTFDLIESNGGSPAEGVRLNTVGGSFTATTTNIVDPTGTGIDVQSSPAGTSFSFGGTTVNKGASVGTGVNLNSNVGTFSFSSLAVTTSNGTGVSATSSGTVNVTTGSIGATGGPALVVNPTAIGMTFTSVSSTNSSGAGISLTSASGSLTITTTTITNPATNGISATSCSATLNFGNTTADTSGSTGVVLGGSGTGNTGTITFADLDIAPDAGIAGLAATDNTNTITTTSGTINSGTGTAVNITRTGGTTPLNMTFTSVSSSGGTNDGISIQHTTGSFTVVGDGANTAQGGNSSGGTIANKSGANGSTTSGIGVYLNDVSNITLRRMTINGTNQNFGLRGANVTGFTLQYATVNGANGNSTADLEDSVRFDNLLGSATIDNCIIDKGWSNNIRITNTTGTLNRVNITNSSIGQTGQGVASTGNDAIGIEANSGGAIVKATIDNCSFTGAHGDMFDATSQLGTTMGVIFTNNQCLNTQANTLSGGGGTIFQADGTFTANIDGNTVTGARGVAINVSKGALHGVMNGTINNNTIGVAATLLSGSKEAAGIYCDGGGAGSMTAAITNNHVHQTNAAGIWVLANNQAIMGNNGAFHATITGNTVDTPGALTFAGIFCDIGTGVNAEATFACLDIGGAGALANDFSAGDPLNFQDIDLSQASSALTRLPGYGGTAMDTAAITAYLKARNLNSAATTVFVGISGAGYSGGLACTAPNLTGLSLTTGDAAIASGGPKSDQPEMAEDQDLDLRVPRGEAPKDEQVQQLRREELDWMVRAALDRWQLTGASAEEMARLQGVTFDLADLATGQVAYAEKGHVRIDLTGGGYGWFFDQTPSEDSEFEVPVPERERQTTEISPANGKMDLLTVIMRELGKVYLEGKKRIPENLRPLLEPTLSPSVRRMPAFNVPERSTSSLKAPAASVSAGTVAAATPVQPKTESPASLLDLKPAVFNPSADLMPGSYERSARRMSFAPKTRSVVQSKDAPKSGETINLMLGTIPVGEKVVIMFSVTVNAANTLPPGTSQVCNQGSVSATGIPAFTTDDPDVAGANNPTCTTLNVADVSVTKSAGSSPVCSTSNITFTINYNNAGPAAAVNALVSDAMPVGTSLVSVTTPPTWTRTDLVPVGGNGAITFSKASSPNADAAVFTIVVSIDASVADGAVIQNTASVTSTTPDPNSANNTSAATSTTVKKPPTTATVGGPQTICALGTTTSLGGNTPVIGTGTWTVQSGGTGTFNPNATIPGATFTHLTGVGPIVLRWTISNPPCPDSFAEVTVTVRAQPTATVGAAQTICALGTTAGLGGNTPTPPATGMWSIVTAGVVGTFNPNATTPGATFTHTSGAIGSTVTLRWTVSNAPCTDATADIVITIKSQPTATVGGPQTICAGGTTAALGGNTPPAGATGTWSIVTAGITGTFNPNANTPNATFTHATGATSPFTLRWTVSNPPCTSATADVMITLLPAPVATTGGPQTICELGTTASLGGNTPAAGETGTWSIVTAGVTGTFNPNANTPGATFTHTSGGVGGNITLRWTVTNPTCGQSATAGAIITVKQQPTATVGGAQTICALGTTAGLGGNTPAGGATGTWTIVTGGATGTFNPTANTPNATFTHLTGSGTITLRWTVTNPPCSSATADVAITITQPPTTATVGSNQTICALGTTAGLGGNTPTTGTGLWTVQSGGTGTFNPSATTPGATFTHLTGTGPIVLRWTISNPPCPDSFAQVTITINQPPTPATVGGAQTICALGTTASLGGNTPTSGTGMWTVQSGGTGTFNPNATTPGATFTHLTGTGPIVLRWTISNLPCPNSFAEVTITITQSPTAATAGGGQSICALGTTAGLGGNTPSSGTGTWTVQSGGTGTFNPTANTPNATFTHLTGTGPIVLRWTIANPPCPDSFAQVTITISQAPTTATVGGPQTICDGSTTAGLGGNAPASGTGTWTVQSGGTGTFNPNANTPNATFTPTSGPGTITLRWTISNPPCPDSFAEVIITVKQQPTATVGGPQTICAGATTVGLGGNTPAGGATGTWTIVTGGATGTFNPNANTPNATFTHTGGTGTITLRWTVSNPPCPNATADVMVTITQPPTTATVGANQIIPPSGTTTPLGGNTPSSGTGMWSIVTAGVTGTFNPNATTPNATWTHATGSGLVVLRWTISNPPCPASFAEVTIQIGIPPTITCPASPVVVSTAPGLCTATVTFTVTATGLPTPTVTCVPPSGSVFPKGNTTVNCTAANGIPPDATCSFTVTVNDTQPPSITCPANITRNTDPNLCSAVVTYPPPTVTDNCPCSVGPGIKNGPAVQTFCVPVCNPPSGSSFPKGTTTVTCMASDASGNTASCTFTVTVNDTQPPTIICPANITAKTPQAGNPCVIVNYPPPTVTDNCPAPTVVCNPPSGSCFPLGTTTVTCTATDTSGNTATCTFKITVFDLCVQDGSNPSTVVLINSFTGDYRFCCNGVTYTGRGTMTIRGSIYTMEHNPLDRRVLVKVDEAVHKGSGSIQAPPGTIRCTITDTNTQDNSCVCQ